MSIDTPAPSMTNVLRAAIKRRGLSAYRISKEIGLAVSSIIRFTDGETSLRLDKADLLAGYLGLEVLETRKAKGAARHVLHDGEGP